MKFSIGIFFTFLLSSAAFAQSNGWIKIAVPNREGSTYSFVDFSDSLHGLLASADGYLTLTSDGGRSWSAVEKIISSGTVFKAKMADSLTVLLAVNPDHGNTKVYRFTQTGNKKDSLLLPAFLDQSKYYGKGTISILNPHLIGFVTLDTSQYFIATKNFGSSWDTVSFDRTFRRAKILAVEALDSIHFFIGASAAGVGLGSGGHLYRSDDGMKTMQEIPTSDFEMIGMKFFTNEFACFGMTHSIDMTASASDILIYNNVTKQSAIFSGGGRELFADMGTLFRDGSKFFISADTQMRDQGNGIYKLFNSTDAVDSLKFSALAIGAQNSFWYLTREGCLFTNSENRQSDSALRYYPLAIGNRWNYTISGGFAAASSMDVTVIKDTVFSNRKTYFKIEYRTPQNVSYDYERIDSSSLNVYRVNLQNPANEMLLDSLGATAGDMIWSMRLSTSRVFCDSIVTRTTLGLSTQWKYFSGRVVGTFPQYALAQGLGLVYRSSLEEDPVYPRYSSRITALVYARINGIEYGTPLSVNDAFDHVPVGYSLEQNYPNPFNPSTTFSFTLPSKSHVSLQIFDVLGRDIATIISDELPAGTYWRQWNASQFPSGMYFYRLQAGTYSAARSLVLVK